MKLSTKIKSSQSDSFSITSWNPEEFQDVSRPQIEPEQLEQLMEIFKPISKEKKSDESKEILGSLYPASITKWSPDEMVFQPFTFGAVETQTGSQNETKVAIFPEQFDSAHIPEGSIDFNISIKEKAIQEIQERAEESFRRHLAEARQQADEIMQQADAKTEAARQKGFQEGYVTGQAEMESAVQTSKAMLEQFSIWRAEMLGQSEQTVMDLVRDIAVKLFSEGFELDKAVLQQVYSEILVNARALGDLRIYVNAEDAKKLDPAWREYQVLISGQRVQILPTEAIKRGGCYIEGQRGSVDARIESQLKTLLDSLSVENESESTGRNG